MSNILKSSIAAVFAVSLAACGGSSDEPSGQVSDPSPAPAEQSEPSEPASDPSPAPTEQPAATPEPSDPAPTETTASTPPANTSEGSPEFADLPAPYNTGDYSRGNRVFRTCSSCHLLDPEAGNLVGPNLHGMFDRKAGELEGFNYSNALTAADFQWTPEELNDWLANPNSYLPGNNMSFAGVRREKDRLSVIAYLLVETNK